MMRRLPLSGAGAAPILGLLVALATGAAAADPAQGVWKTEPDRKSLTSHIRIDACGAALCGTIVKAFDASGKEIRTANVGKRLFWDLKPEGGGRYAGGTVFVPLLNVTAQARAELNGDRLRVTGCKAGLCDGQIWTRLR